MNHYSQYVVKADAQTTNSDLLDKIISKTVGIQTEYVFKIAEQIGKTSEDLI